jgi:hypothetical protein
MLLVMVSPPKVIMYNVGGICINKSPEFKKGALLIALLLFQGRTTISCY